MICGISGNQGVGHSLYGLQNLKLPCSVYRKNSKDCYRCSIECLESFSGWKIFLNMDFIFLILFLFDLDKLRWCFTRIDLCDSPQIKPLFPRKWPVYLPLKSVNMSYFLGKRSWIWPESHWQNLVKLSCNSVRTDKKKNSLKSMFKNIFQPQNNSRHTIEHHWQTFQFFL